MNSSKNILIRKSEHDDVWKVEKKKLIKEKNDDLKKFIFLIGIVFTMIYSIWFILIYFLMI